MSFLLVHFPPKGKPSWLLECVAKSDFPFSVKPTYEGLAPFAKKCATQLEGSAVAKKTSKTIRGGAKLGRRLRPAAKSSVVPATLRCMSGNAVPSEIGSMDKGVEVKEEFQSEDEDAVTNTLPGVAIQDFPDFDDRDVVPNFHFGQFSGNEDDEDVEIKEELITDSPFVLRDPTMPVEIHDMVSEDGRSEGEDGGGEECNDDAMSGGGISDDSDEDFYQAQGSVVVNKPKRRRSRRLSNMSDRSVGNEGNDDSDEEDCKKPKLRRSCRITKSPKYYGELTDFEEDDQESMILHREEKEKPQKRRSRRQAKPIKRFVENEEDGSSDEEEDSEKPKRRRSCRVARSTKFYGKSADYEDEEQEKRRKQLREEKKEKRLPRSRRIASDDEDDGQEDEEIKQEDDSNTVMGKSYRQAAPVNREAYSDDESQDKKPSLGSDEEEQSEQFIILPDNSMTRRSHRSTNPEGNEDSTDEEEDHDDSVDDEKNCPVYGCSEKRTSSEDLVDHMKYHSPPWFCGVCKSVWPSGSHLRIHYRTHTRERPFECDVCKKTFIHKNNLKTHQLTHGDKCCSVCGIRFASTREWENHMRIHTSGYLSCTDCDKTFKNQSVLKIHNQTHTGEKPYACKTCDYKTAYSWDLMKHEKRHFH